MEAPEKQKKKKKCAQDLMETRPEAKFSGSLSKAAFFNHNLTKPYTVCFFFFFFFTIFLFDYARSHLQQAGSLVAACKLLVLVCGTGFPD